MPNVPAPKAEAPPRASPHALVPRWELHPPGGAHARARLAIDEGTTVYVTDGGARWLVRGEQATSAPTLLPDALATVMRSSPDGSGLWFVGTSGNVYPARDPLGETMEPRRPPFPLHSLTAGRVALVGLAESGRVMRTLYGGASWDEVKIGAKPVLEVAMERGGTGLALVSANELLHTTDDGATWHPLAATGVRHVLVAADGDLYVEHGKSDLSVFHDGTLSTPAAPPARVFTLPPSGDGRARVSALRRGAAAFGASHLVSIDLGADGASIVTDGIGEAPRHDRSHELDGCKQAWPAISGDALLVACDARSPLQREGAQREKGWLPLRLLKRDNAHAPFHEEAVLGSSEGEKHVWLSPRGAIFVTGACAAKDAHGGCEVPDALAKPAGSNSFVSPKRTPPRKNVAYLFWYVAYSATGDRLYALADDVNNVHGQTMLLVSKDDGVTFGERYLPAIPTGGGHTLRPTHTGGLFPSSDGTLRITALASDGAQSSWLVYETRDDGTSFDVRVSHLDKPRGIDFHERRGFAWDPHGAGWETLDAGKTWIPRPAPADGVPLAEEHAPITADLDIEMGSVTRKLACDDAGCFLGDVATRIGWTDTGR